MQRISQISFALALIGLAIIGIVHQDFCIIVPPEPTTKMKWFFVLGNFVVIAGCAGVITKRYAYAGSLISASAIFLFSYVFKIVPVFAKSNFLEIINNAGGWEIAALIGGCLIMAHSFKSNKALLKIGLVMESAWFLWAGIGHFIYLHYVESLIPAYIPFHRFWTYFCGVCLMLLSIGLWIPKYRLLAARLSATMFFLWCIMLHIPNYFSHPSDISRLMGIMESLSFASIMGIVTYEFKKRLKS